MVDVFPDPEKVAEEQAARATAAAKVEAERRAIQQCAHRALQGVEQKPLRVFLAGVVAAGSFVPGRSFEDTAWAEGKRAIAAMLLNLGGVSHGE